MTIHYNKAVSLIGLTALLLVLPFPRTALQASPLKSSPRDPVAYSLHLLTSGYGPEDMVIDSLHNPVRILVSCASRRPGYPSYGEIEAIDPAKGTRLIMTRVNDPAGLVLKPHGISLVKAGEYEYLYVINHEEDKGSHPIIRYLVHGDSLIFVKLLNTGLLVSPNALQAYPDGRLLVCNDAAVRNSMKEKIFRQKRGNIISYDGLANWSIVADKLAMPAGLTGLGNRIFVSAALEDKLYSYQYADGQLSGKKLICSIRGPDNIRIQNHNLIITSHSKPLKFILHTRKKTRKSPSLVLSVDPATGSSTRIFYDDGKRISAASVALIFNNQLVIGQIFEPFIGLAEIR